MPQPQVIRVSATFDLLALLASTLLLLASAGKPTHEPLGLIRNPSDGVLHTLDHLPRLIGHLPYGVLGSSASLLALLLLVAFAHSSSPFGTAIALG